MPASAPSHAPVDTTPDPPPTPDGYDDPTLFEYSLPVLMLLSIPLFAVTAYGFGRLLWWLQGPAVFAAVFDVTESADGFEITLELADVALPLLVALVATVVVHELIHGLVMRFYGQDVTYGVHPAMGAFYASAFGQFQAREELLVIGLAPLFCLSVLATPLLVVPVPTVAITGFLVLLFNATGSVGDCYLVWRLWRLPEHTLLYDADLRHWYVFEPSDVPEP